MWRNAGLYLAAVFAVLGSVDFLADPHVVQVAELLLTLLFDGRKAARLLTGTLHGAREIRIRYRSQYRPEIADHSLIVDDEQHGPVLRYRSATENNEVIAGINETGLYAAVADAVTRSLALIHTWHAGELLLVDNHTMLHSRAPFAGVGPVCP